MIMKIVVCEIDKQEEVFEISDYYTECEDYIEAKMKGENERQIILQDSNCMELEDQWESLTIYTDNMVEIIRFAVPEEVIEVEAS